MKKHIWLWVVKISAILLWAITLFIPDIYESIEDVKIINSKEIKQEQSTNDFKTVEIELSKKVLYGHIYIAFYDENDKMFYAPVILFENNNSNFVKLEIQSDGIDKTVRFEIKEVYVKTKNELFIDKISSLISTMMLIVVLAVIRIDYDEQLIEDKKIEIYSGLFKHSVKIDGKKVFYKKWFALIKSNESVINISETKDVKVVFGAMNKIDIEIIEKSQNEVEEQMVVEETKK